MELHLMLLTFFVIFIYEVYFFFVKRRGHSISRSIASADYEPKLDEVDNEFKDAIIEAMKASKSK